MHDAYIENQALAVYWEKGLNKFVTIILNYTGESLSFSKVEDSTHPVLENVLKIKYFEILPHKS